MPLTTKFKPWLKHHIRKLPMLEKALRFLIARSKLSYWNIDIIADGLLTIQKMSYVFNMICRRAPAFSMLAVTTVTSQRALLSFVMLM